MADEFNLVLEHLRHIRATVDKISSEQGRHGRRLTSIERHQSNLHSDMANFRDELDGVKERLDRIETRLGLNDPEH